MSGIKIEDENEIDWNDLWIKKMKLKGDNKRDWSKAAVKYRKRAEKDNYTEQLINNLILDKEDTLLDVGCGEGSVTVPLSKYVKNIIASDSNDKMLEILENRAKEENINNITIEKEDINNLDLEKYSNIDIVLASRVGNGIKNPQEVFSKFNQIANKYVFITIFGPNNWKLQEEFNELANRKNKNYPSYIILLNLLAQIGIYANVINLDVGPVRTYENIDEAMDNGKWRLDSYTDEEKEILKNYLESILKKDPETGLLSNPHDKPDWILIWWKVTE